MTFKVEHASPHKTEHGAVRTYGAPALAAFAVAGQVAALPAMTLVGGVSPFATAALFGAGAAAAGAAFAKRAAPAQEVTDYALHDAVTVGLVLSVAAVSGPVAAVLMLPGAVALTTVVPRLWKGRGHDTTDGALILLTILAFAGLWILTGPGAALISGTALGLMFLLHLVRKALPARLTRGWKPWAVTALASAALALYGLKHGLALPNADQALLAVAAGLTYGAASGLACRIFSRRTALTVSLTTPFAAILALAIMGWAVMDWAALEKGFGAVELLAVGLVALALYGARRAADLGAVAQHRDFTFRQRLLGWCGVI